MPGQPGDTECVDNGARRDLAGLEATVDAHLEHCGERWEATKGSISDLKDSVNSLDQKMEKRINLVHGRIGSLERKAIYLLIGIAGFAILQWLVAAGVVFGTN